MRPLARSHLTIALNDANYRSKEFGRYLPDRRAKRAKHRDGLRIFEAFLENVLQASTLMRGIAYMWYHPSNIGMKSMNYHSGGKCPSFSDAFYGSCTVGERGQIVIPVEARADMGFHPGEKVVIMRHPVHQGLMVFKVDAMREFLDEFSAGLARIEDQEGTDD